MKDDELVKALDETDFSDACPCGAASLCDADDCIIVQAATRIEQLARDNNTIRNELCERCGRYKMAHEGACDSCRWKRGE